MKFFSPNAGENPSSGSHRYQPLPNLRHERANIKNYPFSSIDETDRMLAQLMVKMFQKSQVVIGKHSFSADLGVVQGGVLSPMLFNVYLEEALGTT
jgi:hypothetical protein